MNVKLFELRDRATFIPVFAFRPSSDDEGEQYLLLRAGFEASSHIILGRLECSGINANCTYDAYAWGGRTFPVAHRFIAEHFEELPSGAVIDVEFILGEKSDYKASEEVT